jgi:hypothetical protein
MKRIRLIRGLVVIVILAVVGALDAQTAPAWDYVYSANQLPDRLTPPADWMRETLTGGRCRRKIANGQLHVDTAARLQYTRTIATDPILGLPDLTIEVRSRTDASPVWGLVVGNVFDVGSGRSSVAIWILPTAMKIEHRNPRPIGSPLDSVTITPGDHTFRIARAVSAGRIRIFIDGAQVWSGGLGTPSSGVIEPTINLFYGDDTINHTDYVAYAAGDYSPSDLASPGLPYRLPFAGATYPISQGPSCPGGNHFDRQAEAIDFAMPVGTPIYAAADGTITYADFGRGRNSGFGIYTKISHPDGSLSYYAHLDHVYVTSGNVQKGDLIGLSGNTGVSSGPHLHFQVLDSEATAVPIRTMDGIQWVSTDPNNPCVEDASGYVGYATYP